MITFLLFIGTSTGLFLFLTHMHWRSLGRPGGSFREWGKTLVHTYIEERAEDRRESNITHTRDLPEYRDEIEREDSIRESDREAEIAELEAIFNREENL